MLDIRIIYLPVFQVYPQKSIDNFNIAHMQSQRYVKHSIHLRKGDRLFLFD